MPAGGLVTGAVIGLGTAIYGAIQKSKAEKAARNNVMPTYTIPQSEYNSLDLAESQAGQGMSDASRAILQNNANQGLQATQDNILRGGGNANAIAVAQGGYQQGINQNAIYDDQARVANLSRLQSAYARMSADQDKAFQVNQYAPWANKAQALAQQQQYGQATMMSGIGTAGSALSGYFGAMNKNQPLITNNNNVNTAQGSAYNDYVPTFDTPESNTSGERAGSLAPSGTSNALWGRNNNLPAAPTAPAPAQPQYAPIINPTPLPTAPAWSPVANFATLPSFYPTSSP